MKVSAFVTSTRKAANDYILSTVTSGGRLIVISPTHAQPGAYVDVYGTKIDKEVPEMTAEKVRVLSERELKKVKGDIDKYIDRNCRIGKKLFIKDKVLNSLMPQFEEAARRLKKAVFLHRPIIIRYHNDPDGLCSALALYFGTEGARNIRFFINTYPYYREIECATDLEALHHLDAEYLPPLFIACDFGSNKESLAQYVRLRKAGFELMSIDHHPPHPELKNHMDFIVSSHQYGGGFDQVTGLLATEVAYFIAQVDMHDLPAIALTADRSRISWFKPTDEHARKALALDYLLQVSRYKYTIAEIAKSLDDKEFINILFTEATEKIEEVMRKLMPKMKRKEFGNILVIMFSTDKEFKEGQFPGRGDMAEVVSDELSKNLPRPTVTAGHGEHSINMRLNTAAVRAGLDLRVFIENIKQKMSYAVEAGGGHEGAATIRVKKGYSKSVLEQLLKEIETAASKPAKPAKST
jgi:RecJ-like exonuclease